MSSQSIHPTRSFRPFRLDHGQYRAPKKLSHKLLWVNASPSLKYFDLPLLQLLNDDYCIERWEYQQSRDEACSLEEAVDLLVNYLKSVDRPVHLAGHGLSGVIAMMAADRVPDRVKTLTLLGVGNQPGLTWQAHYYLQRLMIPCSQVRVLAQFGKTLFGPNVPHSIQTVVQLLGKDLTDSPSPHSLYHTATLDPIKPKVPVIIFQGALDFVISPDVIKLWDEVIQPTDRIVSIAEGRHFFHYQFPQQVTTEIIRFWSQNA
jgi:pimeloyl-ACP methyl ester carboxylesterase